MKLTLIAFSFFYGVVHDLPDVEVLDNYAPPTVTRVYDSTANEVLRFYRQRRAPIKYEDLPQHVIDAFISTEDKRFFEHGGIDATAFSRAMVQNLINLTRKKRLLGASTITQQLAKMLFTGSERSVRRKLREAILAVKINRQLEKERVLELYLNQLYFGRGAYGIGQAAKTYFDSSVQELELHEAIFLASLAKAPVTYSSEKHAGRAKARREWIAGQMVENGQINAVQALQLKFKTPEPIPAIHKSTDDTLIDSFYLDQVRRDMIDHFGQERTYDSGFRVEIALNSQLQKLAEKHLRIGLESFDAKEGWQGPVDHIDLKKNKTWRSEFLLRNYEKALPGTKAALVISVQGKGAELSFQSMERGIIPSRLLGWTRRLAPTAPKGTKRGLRVGDVVFVRPISDPKIDSSGYAYRIAQKPAVEGAIVVMDPKTGHVLALSGGYDFQASQFNRASIAYRQPGSAFKPIVYFAALNQGDTAKSIVVDSPLRLGNWAPRNYDGGFRGRMTYKDALRSSRNVTAVKTAMKVGVERLQDYAHVLGIGNKLPNNLTIALGAGEVTLVDLVSAYAVFANGGKIVAPTTIKQVFDSFQNLILNSENLDCETCLKSSVINRRKNGLKDRDVPEFTPESGADIRIMLKSVMDAGTGRRVKPDFPIPFYGKTGTTSDNRDAWFIGFTDDLVVGAFVGYDQPISLGRGGTGGQVAGPIFKGFFTEALPILRPDMEDIAQAAIARLENERRAELLSAEVNENVDQERRNNRTTIQRMKTRSTDRGR